MFEKLRYICVVGSIGLIAADRIDLFFYRGPFTLSPFLILAPLAVALSFLDPMPRDSYKLTLTPAIRRQFPFLVALALFLILAAISVIFGLDPRQGLMSLADLFLVSVLGYFISVRILSEPDQEQLILRSVSFALIVYLIFCLGECIAWSHGLTLLPVAEASGSWMASAFAPSTLFWIPRLSGPIVDPNRAGFVLVMYLFLLDRFTRRSRYTNFLRFAIAIFILLAFSRSAAICWLLYNIWSKRFWRRLASRRVVAGLAASAIVCCIVFYEYQTEVEDLFEVLKVSDVLANRLSGQEGSSGGEHIDLIRRGFDTWTATPHTLVAGIGLASAPKVLGDFFEDRGNFHCLYVTVLAEIGLPAFLVLIVLLGYPMIGRKWTGACIVAIAIYNVPYQSHMEPMFWLALAILWSNEARKHSAFSLDAIPVYG